MSLSAALKNLTKSGKLKPLELRPMPDPIPPNWNLNEYYHFHQRAGHSTDKCGRLKNEIEDLIEAQKKPNVTQNPLPNHQEKPNYQNVPPLLFINMISFDEPLIAPITTKPIPFIFEVLSDSSDEEDLTSQWSKKGNCIVEADYWYEEEEEGVMNLTRGGRHFKPAHLEVDHPGRETEEERKRNTRRRWRKKMTQF